MGECFKIVPSTNTTMEVAQTKLDTADIASSPSRSETGPNQPANDKTGISSNLSQNIQAMKQIDIDHLVSKANSCHVIISKLCKPV